MIPGEHTSVMAPFWWAFAVDRAGGVTLIRCETEDDAIIEHGRLRLSDSKRIGHSEKRMDEMSVRKLFRTAGFKVKSIRWFNPAGGFAFTG